LPIIIRSNANKREEKPIKRDNKRKKGIGRYSTIGKKKCSVKWGKKKAGKAEKRRPSRSDDENIRRLSESVISDAERVALEPRRQGRRLGHLKKRGRGYRSVQVEGAG